MKKFAFRLQVVLDRALDEEEAKVKAMAMVQAELAGKEREISQVTLLRNTTLQAMAATQQGLCDVEELQQRRMHLDALAHTLKSLRDERAVVARKLDVARVAVTEAMRKRQTLEKLRETQYTAYRKELDKQELQQMEATKLPRIAAERAERFV